VRLARRLPAAPDSRPVPQAGPAAPEGSPVLVRADADRVDRVGPAGPMAGRVLVVRVPADPGRAR
jgi:hypothetical protein